MSSPDLLKQFELRAASSKGLPEEKFTPISAEIIADSISPTDCRITTFICTYPRFIHSEIMTHRVFARNAASSRAIPVAKTLEIVRYRPAMPVHWGANQKGMQAEKELGDDIAASCCMEWFNARDNALKSVESLHAMGLHKQLANRLLEPWMPMTCLITATEWENFFALRAHEDAMPEFQDLAFKMLDAYNTSMPKPVKVGGWHIPFGDRMPEDVSEPDRLRIATARAARLSYLTFDGVISTEKDFELHDDLAAKGHWSPFEHPAQALFGPIPCGPFRGWLPYRKSDHFRDREVRKDSRVIKRTFVVLPGEEV